jgi:dihydroneopterin aldolase/2-amino-4-hydroxy-6-hydroxymethyldihydropteridine diphosphokinase
MDKITIKGLEVYAHHGVYPEENRLGQKFTVNVTLYMNTRKAGVTDELEDSVDYGSVCHEIHEFLREHTFHLIEKAAEALAEHLLKQNVLLDGIDIELCKPWAPIGLPVQEVSVSIHREWHTAYIALGSNMGDKEAYIEKAIEELEEHDCCRIAAVSEMINTEPYGVREQDDFLNGCLEMQTLLPPNELLDFLHEIEENNDRERTMHWGPRTLDLDILFYDDLILDTEKLTIPHADMHNREFVLAPMMEIAPYKRHPLLKKSIRQMYEELKKTFDVPGKHMI